MITVFDMRNKQDDDLHAAIQHLYEEPLKVIGLGEHSIKACIGCWTCWLKTPGRCVMHDQMAEIYPDYMNSDKVILLMDTAQGFINHQAKAFLDRTIPHYHPYIHMVDGECHHVTRYASYPDIIFYFDAEGLSVQEEQVVEDHLYRTAYHFCSKAFRMVKNNGLKILPLESRKAKNRLVEIASTDPMEKLVIYNGSPRRNGGNSALILSKIAQILGDRVEVRDLKSREKWAQWAEAFKTEKDVMFFMPLYVHAMPSHVMGFFEKLSASQGTLSFFVQSGFPESSQSFYLEAYLEQFASKLGRIYLGTAIKGGMEGLRMRSPKAQEIMIQPIASAIENLVHDGRFNPGDMCQLAKPIRFGKGIQILFNLFGKKMMNSSFWDPQLKANAAFEKRFDRPYETQAT